MWKCKVMNMCVQMIFNLTLEDKTKKSRWEKMGNDRKDGNEHVLKDPQRIHSIHWDLPKAFQLC